MLDELNKSLIVVTGGKGTGKSSFAYTVAPPSKVDRVFVHDAENSGNRFVQQLEESGKKFGHYLNLNDKWCHALPEDNDLLTNINNNNFPWLNSRERDSMVSYYKFVIDDIEKNLTKGKFDVYIHDTIERLEASMKAYVEANRGSSGWNKYAFGEFWVKGVYPLYQALISAIFQRGVKVIVFTTHLRTPWTTGDNPKQIIGAVEPKGKSILYTLSQLHLWLVNDYSNPSGAPAALVMKERLGRIGTSGDRWKINRCLPPRIPEATWDSICKYVENGIDMSNLTDKEKLSESEENMLSMTLSNLQMELMILETRKEIVSKQANNNLTTSNSEKQIAITLFQGGSSVEEIAKQLNKPTALIKTWVK